MFLLCSIDVRKLSYFVCTLFRGIWMWLWMRPHAHHIQCVRKRIRMVPTDQPIDQPTDRPTNTFGFDTRMNVMKATSIDSNYKVSLALYFHACAIGFALFCFAYHFFKFFIFCPLFFCIYFSGHGRGYVYCRFIPYYKYSILLIHAYPRILPM